MHTTALLTLALIIILAPGVGAKDLDSRWVDKPFLADGDLKDWQGIRFESYKDFATYAVCNDSDNVFIVIRFREPMWLRSIRLSGLTIWINNQGKKDKILGFRYNGGPGREEMQRIIPDSGRQRRGEMAKMVEADHARMTDSMPVTFAVLEKDWWFQPTPIAADGKNGPSVGFGIDNGIFCYEFAIPMAPSEINFFGGNIAPGKKIRIGFEWGGVERSEKPRAGMHASGLGIGDGRPGDGGTGGPPGDKFGQPASMDRGDIEKYLKKQEFWVKTNLARKK